MILQKSILFLLVLLIGGALYLFHLPVYVTPEPDGQGYGKHYDNGRYHNEVDVPVSLTKENLITGAWQFLTENVQDARPDQPLPSKKTDLLHLAPDSNVVIWMGHSSFFIQMDGVKYLVDPVFSDNASPVPFTNRAFTGSNIYTAADIPDIDYLLITHDHWDHLDYPTINSLRDKIGRIVVPEGVGSYFRQWDFNPDIIIEKNWYETWQQKDLTIHFLPAQHFSGRFLKRNQTLWGSFALITPIHKIYLGGDSGYGPHFREIARRLGGFDLAILESGQYDRDWPYIHMMPAETARAAEDLQAKALLPSHNSKFVLAKHAWYTPLDEITRESQHRSYHLLTPEIGEAVFPDNPGQHFSQWWHPLSHPRF
jgi:L-ascorbate metabolism protein UlaG (beta-lactamase superfamily)